MHLPIPLLVYIGPETIVNATQASHETETDESLPTTTNDWLQDMKLMHHYSTVLSKEPLLVRDGGVDRRADFSRLVLIIEQYV